MVACNLLLKFILIILLTSLLSGCFKRDPVTGQIENVETDPKKKAEEFAKKGGGLFGDIGKSKSSTTYEFATSNILWRATLKSLDFLPISNVDYSGGVIVFDWYSDERNQQDQIKLSVRFLSNELRSDSIQVIGHKKTCTDNFKCATSKVSENFSNEIKDQIITLARTMKIEENKLQKK